MISISEIINAELAARAQLERDIISIVLSRWQPGIGWTKRGVVHNYIYASLGFHGRIGNPFSAFLIKIIQDHGFRKGYASGRRVYYGLIEKAD